MGGATAAAAGGAVYVRGGDDAGVSAVLGAGVAGGAGRAMIHEADCDGECLAELITRLVAREFGPVGVALLEGMRRPGCVRVVERAPTPVGEEIGAVIAELTGRVVAVPPEERVARLDAAWDRYFRERETQGPVGCACGAVTITGLGRRDQWQGTHDPATGITHAPAQCVDERRMEILARVG